MEQRPCPRCGTPCTVERCLNCGAFVPPSLADILTGGELLTHGRPEPEAQSEPAAPAEPHHKDPADRTDEIPVIRDEAPTPFPPAEDRARQSGPQPVTLGGQEPGVDQTLPTSGAGSMTASPTDPDPVVPATADSPSPNPSGSGARTATPTGSVPADPPSGAQPVTRSASESDQSHAAPQRFGPQPAAAAGRRRGPVVAVAAATALLLTLGVVLTLVLRQPSVEGVAQPAETPAATATSAQAPSSSPTTDQEPVVAPSTSAAPAESTEVASGEPTAAPTTETPSSSAPAAPVDEDIACQAGGWMVQLASEADEATYTNRVAALQALGQVPEGAKTARTGSSCGIFTTQTNSIVLWSGPFASAYDACPARWAGPPDAFIKGTTPDVARTYFSCLCPGDPTTFTWLQTGSTDVVLIGELQRILGNRLNTPIPDLQGNWGTFTSGTQAAVSTFQTKSGLPATGIVDTATWVALNTAQCS